jgi:hypothetical protein
MLTALIVLLTTLRLMTGRGGTELLSVVRVTLNALG